MKYFKSILLIAFIALTGSAKSQTIQEVLKDPTIPITYYGIDFTKALLIGDATANTKDIVERQYAGINDVVVKESKKYKFTEAFRRNELLPVNLEFVTKKNSAVNPDKIISLNTADYNRLSEKDIVGIVKNYQTSGTQGLGLLFVVDGMNKAQERMSAWIVLFDNKTKKIILNERHEGKISAAFGFRNYWASGIKNIITSLTAANKKR